jgi:hypothetical protein
LAFILKMQRTAQPNGVLFVSSVQVAAEQSRFAHVFLSLQGDIDMSTVAPSSTTSADAAIAKMEAAFDAAIEKSAKITEITTEKKTELDATKQRPQN